jgi:cytidylate kinase
VHHGPAGRHGGSIAKKKIKEVDKDRSSYYRYYTDQVWGDVNNYDLCVNSSRIGVSGTVDVIKAYIDRRCAEDKK